MTPISEERGVTTWRPLLAIDKAMIYDAASTLELPHLADSTDPTCQRGLFGIAGFRWSATSSRLLPGFRIVGGPRRIFNRGVAREVCSIRLNMRAVCGARVAARRELDDEAPSSFWVDVLATSWTRRTGRRTRPSRTSRAG